MTLPKINGRLAEWFRLRQGYDGQANGSLSAPGVQGRSLYIKTRRVGRVVNRAALEKQSPAYGHTGSNPVPSALRQVQHEVLETGEVLKV